MSKIDFLLSNVNEIPWRKSTFASGVMVKDLGQSGGLSVQMVKFDPETKFPPHHHKGPEVIYMISGSAIQQGRLLSPNSVSIAPAGTSEDDFFSPNGCEFLLLSAE
jgi:quercetin dioxygenase-like cupin family protein